MSVYPWQQSYSTLCIENTRILPREYVFRFVSVYAVSVARSLLVCLMLCPPAYVCVCVCVCVCVADSFAVRHNSSVEKGAVERTRASSCTRSRTITLAQAKSPITSPFAAGSPLLFALPPPVVLRVLSALSRSRSCFRSFSLARALSLCLALALARALSLARSLALSRVP